MSTKGRTKFTVSGIHPLLGFIRDHFISRGFALVSWEDEFDFALIGADIGDEEHPPLAQIELQKMQVVDKPVFLLSTPKASHPDTGAGVYALASEYLFGLGECLSVRPYNLYGPSITHGLVHAYILASKRKAEFLPVPAVHGVTSFLYEYDFVKIIDKLMVKEARGTFDVGSSIEVSYRHAASNIWQFVNGVDSEIPHLYVDGSYAPKMPFLAALEDTIAWLPKTSLRSGLLKML